MKIIARCEKCGREFVTVNPNGDMIDHYLPQDKPLPPLAERKECGGKIVMRNDERVCR